MLKYNLFKLLNINVITSYYGVKFYSNYQDLTFKLCVTGKYGDLLYKYLKNFPNKYFFLDIGANQGLYSLIAAKTHNCIGCVAFEPVLNSFELMKKNIRLNKLEEKITLHKNAVGSSNTIEAIKLVSGHSGAASMSNHLSTTSTEIEFISVVNWQILNELLSVPKAIIIIVKIDTEGFEEIVISELMKTEFWEDISSLFIEVDEAWIDFERLFEKLNREKFVEISRTGTTNHYDVLMERHYETH